MRKYQPEMLSSSGFSRKYATSPHLSILKIQYMVWVVQPGRIPVQHMVWVVQTNTQVRYDMQDKKTKARTRRKAQSKDIQNTIVKMEAHATWCCCNYSQIFKQRMLHLLA